MLQTKEDVDHEQTAKDAARKLFEQGYRCKVDILGESTDYFTLTAPDGEKTKHEHTFDSASGLNTDSLLGYRQTDGTDLPHLQLSGRTLRTLARLDP